MQEEQRPTRVLCKGENQEVTCKKCGEVFSVENDKYSATCPKCGTRANWGMNK